MQKTYNTRGEVTKRIVYTNHTPNARTRITQVPTSDGGWWNIKIERVGLGLAVTTYETT